jgi:predicted transcriptional regulator
MSFLVILWLYKLMKKVEKTHFQNQNFHTKKKKNDGTKKRRKRKENVITKLVRSVAQTIENAK